MIELGNEPLQEESDGKSFPEWVTKSSLTERKTRMGAV